MVTMSSSSRAHSLTTVSGTSRVARAATLVAAVAGGLLLRSFRGHLARRGKASVCTCVFIRELEQTPAAASPVAARGRGSSAYAAYFGRSTLSRPTIASRLAAMLPAIAEALPPPGTGSADARLIRELARVSVRHVRQGVHAADCRYVARPDRARQAT